MRWRVLTVTSTLLVVGALAGWALGQRGGDTTYASDPPEPVAASPTGFPGDVAISADPDVPPVAAGLPLVRRDLGVKGIGVSVAVPRGWEVTQIYSGEWRVRPAGYPFNSYFLRVEFVDTRGLTVAQATADRLHDLRTSVDDVAMEVTREDRFVVTYVSGSGHRRLGMERFFDPHATGLAGVTIAAVGRLRDREGLADLFARVSESVRPY